MSVAFRPSTSARDRTALRAVFLHSAWRSAGTWIWNEFRAHPNTMAFYEPLHEELSAITLERLTETNTRSWDSGHPSTAPYFLEFAPLLHQARRGVSGFHRSLAFDRFFIDEKASDGRLFEYLTRLHNLAQASGKTPVLKFCRSLGRTAWMRRNFPTATHVAILRSPLAQWESSYRLAENGAPYFLAMPLAILASNPQEPLVKSACSALELRLSHLRGFTFKSTLERAEAFVKSADAAATYRGFLAFWLATALACVPHAEIVIDSDRLSRDSTYRAGVQDELSEKTGVPVDFASARTQSRVAGVPSLGDVEPFHAAARRFACETGAPAIVAEKLMHASAERALFVPA